MILDGRRLAGLAGFCTFLNLYMPQALLPALAPGVSGVGAAGISAIITASTDNRTLAGAIACWAASASSRPP